MKNLLKITVAAVLVLCTSCCPCKKLSKNCTPLVGTTWGLTEFMGSPVKTDNNYQITLSEDGRFNGVGDCNRFFGQYTMDQKKNSFKISAVGATKMMCPNQQMEDKFLRMFDKADSFRIDGKMLMLLSNSELIAVFEAVKTEPAKNKAKK